MIIKFKSVLMDNSHIPEGFDPGQIDTFNTYFKGKYCYLMRGGSNILYAVAFADDKINGLSESDYEEYIMDLEYYIPKAEEISIEMVMTETDWSTIQSEFITNYSEYIDLELTGKANSVSRLVALNRFEPDNDLTIDDLRQFRLWIADQLYERYVEGQVDADEKFKDMLNYYRSNNGEMNDEATILISTFTENVSSTITTPATHVGCGCNTFTVNPLTTVSVCDAMSVYRKSIHDYMVEKFTDLSLWTNYDDEKDFLIMFKKYIDGIILNDFPLYAINSIGYGDCACISDQMDSQAQLMQILKNLSTSIQYMIDDAVSSHKNFIYENFYNWSNSLYEIMRW